MRQISVHTIAERLSPSLEIENLDAELELEKLN